MHDMPATVLLEPPGTEAQREWLRRTRIPLASIVFGPSNAPPVHHDSLAQLPLDDVDCLKASEATLHSFTGLEATSATRERFVAFSRRFSALQTLRLNLPDEKGEAALQLLSRSLRHLGANGEVSSFQVQLCALLCCVCTLKLLSATTHFWARATAQESDHR